MVHKLALLIGGVAATVVLAVAISAAGFAPNATDTAATPADKTLATGVGGGAPNDDAPNDLTQKPSVKIVTDTVYVEPTPDQQVVHERGDRDRGDDHDGGENDHDGQGEHEPGGDD